MDVHIFIYRKVFEFYEIPSTKIRVFPLTCWVTKEDMKIEMVATAPPMNTVQRIPILSTKIPAMGEQHNVEPNVSDPIKAIKWKMGLCEEQ